MGLKKVLRKMTLKSSDRPNVNTTTPWIPEPLPKAKTMSMEEAEIVRQAAIDHYYDHCHKVMEIILEDIIDYSEFKTMKPELAKDELDRAYFTLFDNWDIVRRLCHWHTSASTITGDGLTSRQLKHIMLRYVRIDAELGCLDVLISFGMLPCAIALSSVALLKNSINDHELMIYLQVTLAPELQPERFSSWSSTETSSLLPRSSIMSRALPKSLIRFRTRRGRPPWSFSV